MWVSYVSIPKSHVVHNVLCAKQQLSWEAQLCLFKRTIPAVSIDDVHSLVRSGEGSKTLT